jgi:type IV secretion system protein VirB5
MQNRILKTLLLCAMLVPATSRAQFAVIDIANLQQALQQVSAWQKQYQQMAEQQGQLKQQYSAITGSRGLGNYASDPRLLATVPNDLLRIYDALQNQGASGLTGGARAIRDKARIYDCGRQTAADLRSCERLLSGLAQHLSLLQESLALTTRRGAQVQALQDKINTTTDAKSIAELQARLQAENLQINNDANRLALMHSLADANERAAEQAVRESTLRSLSRNDNGSASFRFVVPHH